MAPKSLSMYTYLDPHLTPFRFDFDSVRRGSKKPTWSLQEEMRGLDQKPRKDILNPYHKNFSLLRHFTTDKKESVQY